MNKKEQTDFAVLKIEVGNNTKQLEKILINDLPHLRDAVSFVKGRLSVLTPLMIAIAVGLIYLILTV